MLGSYNGATTNEDLRTIVSLAPELGLTEQVTRVWPFTELHDAIAAVRKGEVVRAVLDLS